MRPGSLLIRLTVILAFAALLATVVPMMAWAVAAAFFALLMATAAEGVILRRVRFDVERQPKLALPLDEREDGSIQIATTARSALRLTVRQRWPDIVEP